MSTCQISRQARRVLFLAVGACLALSACGGGGGEDNDPNALPPNQGSGWITISGPSTTTTVTALISGEAFVSPKHWHCCSGNATDTAVTVHWANDTTGASDSATQTVSENTIFGVLFMNHYWRAKVPIVLGSNVITATAQDADGNVGYARLTVTRTPDTTPPTVDLTSPADGASGVPLDANLSVEFDEPMDPNTVNAGSFLLFDSNNNPIPGTVTYTGYTAWGAARLNPTNLLIGGTTYTAKITRQARDLAGNNALASDFVWSFSTGSNRWLPLSTPYGGVPWISGQVVWTGTRMLTSGSGGSLLDNGASYDPQSDSWQSISSIGGPGSRGGHSAIWTGSEMIVWGGVSTSPVLKLNTGAIYNPLTDTWRPMTTIGAPSPRTYHTAVWTGTEMIVWGGFDDYGTTNTGGIYNPSTDTWRPVTTNGAPSARQNHTAVWTGTEMIVWGGHDAAIRTNTGARYDPATDSWQPTATLNAPLDRDSHSAIWTGTKMVVWGGARLDNNGLVRLNTGGQYDPSTDSWQPTTTLGAPSARAGHAAVWTGSEMFTWGGFGQYNAPFGDGGRYDPLTNHWSSMNAAGAPSTNGGHRIVWTGTLMLVWGCDLGCSGGRYIP